MMTGDRLSDRLRKEASRREWLAERFGLQVIEYLREGKEDPSDLAEVAATNAGNALDMREAASRMDARCQTCIYQRDSDCDWPWCCRSGVKCIVVGFTCGRWEGK